MTLAEVQALLEPHRLRVLGGFHPGPADGTPAGCNTLLLLGPNEPRFWPHFETSAERADGRPDAMDRWSRRIIEGVASDLKAEALFPFGGSPYLPFYSWALKTNRAFVSPVMFLVHDLAGLFLSFRGALAFSERLSLSPTYGSPCFGCTTQPCTTACPVGALGPSGYDVDACKEHVRSDAGHVCRTGGCLARRACPVSQTSGRLPEQSAYHMDQFIGGSL